MSELRTWWRYELMGIMPSWLGFLTFLWMAWRSRKRKRTPFIYRWSLINWVESMDGGEEKLAFEMLFGPALYRSVTDKARRRRMAIRSASQESK